MMVGIQLGGWSLSMVGRLSPHNVVDDEKSPAFIALDEALGALRAVKSRAPKLTPEIEPSWEYRVDRLRLSHTGPVSTSLTVQEEAKSLFYMLLQKLREAFESGTASPSDHTPDNQTLLHVCHPIAFFTFSFFQFCAETVAEICYNCDAMCGFA
jgi:hypothetical protein